MGIPLESGNSSSKNNIEEPRLPNTAGQTRKTKSSLTGKQGQKKSTRLASDSIGHYLSSIGRVPLLTAAEEIELAHHVQNMKKLLEMPEDNRSSRHRYQIKVGKRARDRILAHQNYCLKNSLQIPEGSPSPWPPKMDFLKS